MPSTAQRHGCQRRPPSDYAGCVELVRRYQARSRYRESTRVYACFPPSHRASRPQVQCGVPPRRGGSDHTGNILLDSSGRPKLADFGLSRVAVANQTMTGQRGTFQAGGGCRPLQLIFCQWMAPEVLNCQRYSEAADIFSFGATTSERKGTTTETMQASCSGSCARGTYPTVAWTRCRSVHHTPSYSHPQQAALAVLQVGLRPVVPTWTPPQLQSLISVYESVRPTALMQHADAGIRTPHCAQRQRSSCVLSRSWLGRVQSCCRCGGDIWLCSEHRPKAVVTGSHMTMRCGGVVCTPPRGTSTTGGTGVATPPLALTVRHVVRECIPLRLLEGMAPWTESFNFRRKSSRTAPIYQARSLRLPEQEYSDRHPLPRIFEPEHEAGNRRR